MISLFTEGVLFKNENGMFIGTVKDFKSGTTSKIVCKQYKEGKYNVFIEVNDKLKLVGTMVMINPIKVRGDKMYKQIAVMKLFDSDYDYSVLEDISKNGKVFYKII